MADGAVRDGPAGTPDGTSAGEVRVDVLRGSGIGTVIDELARLRIAVFRDWPYLYDGDADYEARYLAGYASNPDAVVVTVRADIVADGPGDVARGAGERLVGAATGMPLIDHDAALADAFGSGGLDPGSAFYCAESVLLGPWRGRGLGHRFFDEREAHARALGFRYACFCAVVRPDDHPARPDGARDLAPFWEARGYRPLPGALAHLSWRDVGDAAETSKPLAFRVRGLEPPGAGR